METETTDGCVDNVTIMVIEERREKLKRLRIYETNLQEEGYLMV